MKKHHIVILAVGIGIGAYIIYRNYYASNAGANANPAMGGVDFGVLDPSSW
jgi:hypothetical protein